ncbi:MAG: NAD(P)H-dependent oxidoreductase [Burkholderiaceae bacterium]|nr:NAD(P)H-dependent oxidoreductase [Burkholderiaceae bacterium]
MNILLVLAHPERHSFNGAMFDTALHALEAAGHTVATSDLYRMGFDPVSSRRNFRRGSVPPDRDSSQGL